MKQKIISAFLLILLAITLFFSLCGCERDFQPVLYETTLDIGAEKEFTFLHISDTHLTESSRGSATWKQAVKRSRRFEYMQEKKLTYAINLATEKNAFLVHTGDIMDFISDENIKKAKGFLHSTDCLYVPGNHETDNISLEKYTELNEMSTRNIDFFVEERNGILFVGIDNSQHKMTEKQLSSLKETVALGKPIFLLVHVPLYEKSLYDVSIVDDGSAYLMAVPENLTKNYPEQKKKAQQADSITYEAYEYIKSQTTVKAIFAGHLHMDYQSNVGNIPQYVVGLDSINIVTVR